MAENLNITPEMVDNLVKMFKTNSKQNDFSSESNESSPLEGLDLDTIMKIKNVMDSFNSKNNKDANLLYSLKPYLRKSRQDKIDQYINILKISQVSKFFKDGKGDN